MGTSAANTGSTPGIPIPSRWRWTIVRRYTDIQELTAEIIREFVEKVYVYQTERVAGYKVQRIRIVWNCIGEFDPPFTKGQGKTA